MDTIYGSVSKVTYYDSSKAFTIIKLKIDYKDKKMAKYKEMLFSNTISVLTSIDRKPIENEEYSFDGEFESSNYGMQFKAKTFKRLNEDSKEGIITYLSSDLFPTIGVATATKVFDALGNNCLDMITKDKSVLDKVNIDSRKKDIIYDNLVFNALTKGQIVDLISIGFTMHMALIVLRHLGNDASAKIRENPYMLIYLIEGISFIKADAIANNIGISKSSPLRLKAAILFVLNNFINTSGNTCILDTALFYETSKLINIEEEYLNIDYYYSYLEELKEEKKIVIDEDKYIYTPRSYEDEYQIARRVYTLLQNTKLEYKIDDVPKVLEEVMKNNNITYTDKQKEAITKALTEPVIIITGGPGTGKSTIIKGIVDTYANMYKHSEIVASTILLCAPTGRAAKRLKEVTLHDASTIHKALGYEGKDRYTVTSATPLESKLVIIDEFSMVDSNLAARILSCIKDDTKVVFVGDADQLPSVGCGNVLVDLIKTKEITTIKLDRIHRQSADSSIISLAHKINHGEIPYDIATLKNDRNFITTDDAHIIPIIEKTIETALEKGMNIIKDIQVLVPLYRGEVGIDSINVALQKKFNPLKDGDESSEVIHFGRRFRVNDKVIQLVNRSEKGIMNGDIGYILKIHVENEKLVEMKVSFDSGVVSYSKDELEDLNLAYAISIHKSQGSEFPLIIIPFSFRYYIMLKRKLIYTAVTRAKKYLIMVGNLEAIRKGVVEIEDERETRLALRIKEVFSSSNTKEGKIEKDDLSPFDFL